MNNLIDLLKLYVERLQAIISIKYCLVPIMNNVLITLMIIVISGHKI